MSTAAEVLLIIVSSVLAIFLVALIIVAIYFIKVLKEMRRITAKAENVVGSVESAAQAAARAASPIAVFKLIGGIVGHAAKANKRRR